MQGACTVDRGSDARSLEGYTEASAVRGGCGLEEESKGGEHDGEPTGGREMTRPCRRKEGSGEAPIGAGGCVFCVCIMCVRAL